MQDVSGVYLVIPCNAEMPELVKTFYVSAAEGRLTILSKALHSATVSWVKLLHLWQDIVFRLDLPFATS